MNLTINFLPNANRAWRAARFPIDVSGADSSGNPQHSWPSTVPRLNANSILLKAVNYKMHDVESITTRLVSTGQQTLEKSTGQ